MANGHNLFVAFDLVHPLNNYERLARTIATLGTPDARRPPAPPSAPLAERRP